ncbi:conserved hypothetical protein [Flavobacterium sp. 9AF]|uniref:hypothetical protein n=1 Tax=Flavobacterium sp. 9AF TaxID=2653142 RepID=UPI0012F0E992|nr:hypothetical protein [Flavobacterium sp. 9AF]VXC01477.1 conserved hypothetical protein [Flavobacterium sp. 9AF]
MAKITITNSGQTTTLNETNLPEIPEDGLQRIVSVYFAKKVVTQNGTSVTFNRIDSLNNPQMNYDAFLGQTIYLIIETSNMRALEIDAIIKPSTDTITGSTDSLNLMKFNPEAQAGSEYEASALLTATVGNFDALNDRDGSHAHYTNLETNHADKAIIKLQLRPNIRATFDTWATNLGTTSRSLEVVVERHDKQACAYRNTTEEIYGAETFLNSDAEGRFRIVNRVIFTIYHADNTYNILELNAGNRRRLAKVENNTATQATYFYYNEHDVEIEVATCNLSSVLGRTNGTRLQNVPTGYISQNPAPAGGEAQTNYYYANGNIVTQGTNTANPIVRYGALTTNVVLVRMPDNLAINNDGTVINYVFSGTQRRFCNPQCFAAFVGALAQFGQRMTSTGMCFGDATSYPSVSHPNGDSVDTTYAANLATEQLKVNGFHDYGFAHILRGQTGWKAQLQNSTYHTNHETHLHSGDFNDDFLQILNA